MRHRRWRWRFDTPEKYQTMMKNYYRLASEVDYDSAVTVELLLDEDGSFYSMEMITRIQVDFADDPTPLESIPAITAIPHFYFHIVDPQRRQQLFDSFRQELDPLDAVHSVD